MATTKEYQAVATEGDVEQGLVAAPEAPPSAEKAAEEVEKPKKLSRSESRDYPSSKKSIHGKKSVAARTRACSNCGHISQWDATPEIYPPPRANTQVHQQSFTFVGYVLLIAVVIFLTFVAIKYIA